MKPRSFAHRQRLTSVPADGFMEIQRDTEDCPVPQYMPLNLLSTATPTGQLAPVYLDAANQSLTGAGVINITSSLTLWTSSGAAQAITLANGTITGQMKTVVHAVDGGDGVLTPATFEDGTDVTFTNVGESWTGIWTGTTWRTVNVVGAVIG